MKRILAVAALVVTLTIAGTCFIAATAQQREWAVFRLPASKYDDPVQGTIVPWGGGLAVITPRSDTLQFRMLGHYSPQSERFVPDSTCIVHQDGAVADSVTLGIGVSGTYLTHVTFLRFGQVKEMAAPLRLPRGEAFLMQRAMRVRTPCMFDLLDLLFIVTPEVPHGRS